MTSTAEPGARGRNGRSEDPPLGLYLHFPWCVRKCPYCDFNSHQVRGPVPAEAYLDALLDDLDRDLPLAGGRRLSSIYFGGGTPSLLAAEHVARLLRGIRARLELGPDAEISLEANPGTVEHDSFAGYRDAGINRVSLGVQSFDAGALRAIGRIHGRAEIEAALGQLRAAGLDNFNIDLMFGLPGQRPEQAAADVAAAVAAGPAHVSYYQLTVEPNTAFAAAPPALPAEEACWAMQEAARDHLEAAGFTQYEISGWARPGSECRHNLNYWRYGDYLGIGAGAHGKVTDAAGVVRRTAKHRHPRAYLAGRAPAEDRTIGARERIFEYFLNRLRLREGVCPGDFSARTGLPWTAVAEVVDSARARGLLTRRGECYVHTELGWRFVNDLQALFLP